jgi:threonine dehydrogenase-like Zn-dependent dehydrogenase
MREHFYEIDSGFNIRDIYWFQLKLCALVHFALTSKNIIFARIKEQIMQWMSEGKFNTKHLPIETWAVSECQKAFEYKDAKGDDVFKVLFDWENKK